jgi:hypothetical protein
MADSLNKIGKCINFGNCASADTKKEIEIKFGDDFVCPDCGLDLVEVKKPSGVFPKWLIKLILGALALAGSGIAAFHFFSNNTVEMVNVVKENLTITNNETEPLPESIVKNPVPPVEEALPPINIVVNVPTISSGESATLSYSGGSGNTFKWYSGSCGGTLVGEGNNLKVTPTETTTYYGRWEDGDKVSACQTITVTVKENSVSSSSSGSTKHYSFGKYVGGLKNGYPEGDGTMTYTRRVQIAKHDKDKNLQPVVRHAEAGDSFVGSWGNGDIVSGTLYDRNGNIKEKIFTSKRPNPYDISND